MANTKNYLKKKKLKQTSAMDDNLIIVQRTETG